MSFSTISSNKNTENLNKVSQLVAIERIIEKCNITNYKITTLNADCSFRKYYRIFTLNSSYILMDASLELSSIKPFVDVDNFLIQQKLSAPRIYQQNLQSGLLLLEDFGNYSYTNYL